MATRAEFEPLRAAISLGACLIDTAEAYGTEEVAGRAINGVRGRVFLSTKVFPIHFRRSDVLSAAEKSRERLQTNHIDLYSFTGRITLSQSKRPWQPWNNWWTVAE